MRIIRCLVLQAFICCVGTVASAAQAAPARPNIVIFITDDQGQPDSTPYGGADFRTPNMQRLAEAGMRFTHAFVASPSCAPSRAALLTGLMPARNGAEANHSKPLPAIKKWPAYFKELGYEVAAFGKVSHYKHTPDYGFDVFAHDGFHEHASIGAAVAFLNQRDKSKPLCLFVGSNWPHVPWPEQAEEFDPDRMRLPAASVDTPLTRQWRTRYASAVENADKDLGVIHVAVRKALGENVVFIFTSDHGAQWPFGKWNLYDAGVRVPLIVVWPGVVPPGSQSDAMVSWIDLLPTALEAAGGNAPPNIDGRSFLPTLRNPRQPHRDRIFVTHSGDGRWNVYPMRGLRTPGWKYILNLHPEYAFTTHIDLPGTRENRAYWSTWEDASQSNGQAAAVVRRYHARPAEELYDLAADPHEQRNVVADPAHAQHLAEMRKELAEWMIRQGDRRTVFARPRLLSDPASHGPGAAPGNAP